VQPPSVLPAAPAGAPGNRRGPARLTGTAQVLARKLAAPRGKPRQSVPRLPPTREDRGSRHFPGRGSPGDPMGASGASPRL